MRYLYKPTPEVRAEADSAEYDYFYFHSPRFEVRDVVPESVTSILDVGCGGGAFLDLMRTERPELRLRGVEYNDAVAEVARQKGLDVVTATFPPDDDVELGHFDCIVFNDVLEHLVDPWEALRRSRDLLAPGGIVIASIPNLRNSETLVELAVRGDFQYQEAGVLDRTHLRFFTKQSIVRMFAEAGYTVSSIEGINKARSRRTALLNSIAGLFLRGLRQEGLFRQFLVVAEATTD